jgi:hypothetical protein
MSIEVPDGVVKRDAREIVPEDRIFLVKNTYAAFSDVFRYNMLHKLDIIWVDADTLCLTKNWNFFKDDILFCKEYDNYYVGGVLKLPHNSDITKNLMKQVSLIDPQKMTWAEMGPTLLTASINKYGLQSYCQDMEVLCCITPNDAIKLWDKKYYHEVMQKLQNKKSKTASLYNGMLTVFGDIDTTTLPKGSAIEYLYRRFVTKEVL